MAKNLEKMILSPPQQAALDALLPVGRIATSGIRVGLPVIPRTHSIIVGPSGSGKSYLARKMGEILGIPTLVINVGTWIITASRSEPWSINSVVDWLDRLPGGGILVLDEIDKLSSPNEWSRYVRLEIHDILDGIIPVAATIPAGCLPEEAVPDYREHLMKKLRDRIMVIGCGAWQSAWKSNGKTMGFSANQEFQLPEPPTREQISENIDAELRQRFRDEITIISPMISEDYKMVAKNIARQIPEDLRRDWDAQLGATIRQAVDGSLGMRAMEELLLKALLLSGKGKEPESLPLPQSLKPPRPEPDPFPFQMI